MQASFSRRDLIAPDRLRGLMQRSDLRGALQLASHFGAIVISGALLWVSWGSWWSLPVFMLHGVLLNFLYAAQHELSHSSVFKTKWPNMVFGRLVGFIQLFPRDFDWIMHSAHHQHTANWEKDGELRRQPYTLRSYLLWMSGTTYWRNRIAGLLRHARGIVLEPYVRPDQHGEVTREARWHLAGYALIALLSVVLQSWAAILLWLAPMMIMKPVHQLQNTIEHLGLSHESDIFKNTRSTRTNAVLRWLCWQMPYHTAHHAFPSVPFWQLKELDAELKGNGAEPHAMGWIEFQVAVIKALAQKDESQYPYDEVWIVSTDRGVRSFEAA
ncbi:putative hydrocarbon oxygenase MocD [Candidatus Rhodobacter oscarellae]|uniref:Putative hydrocarbon oxygenase MocD n=1 Tax=Candidatus Rhodobacter oscarellae TaxID=1675527 RepID=A0A0J9H3U0_9RHOB|nr:fatty acid desaturase [Candidatus Rhodobacter lobularis]KMW60348.1 putative hydrocarbon oxygenase MocD [Candidatus Rhodobacter lobularis]